MKKTLVVAVIVGCLLLLANASVAVGASIRPVSIKKTVDTTLPEIDDQIKEDKNPPSLDEEKNTSPVNGDEQDTISLLIEEQVVNEKSNKCFDIKTRNLLTNQRHQVQLSPANAGGPYSGESGDVITFDGSSCFLGVSYEWDFGDGTIGYGLRPTHVYSTPGVYDVTLTVTKTNGDTYMDIAPVYIGQDGSHLIPRGGCRYKADVDEEITFDGSQSISTDPDAPITKWIWHFGDGTVGYGKKVAHSYSKEKVYLVTLEVRDRNGNTRQDILHADIGHEYTCIEDFFITSDSELENILNILLTRLGSLILYPLLSVKIYTNYNGYEQTISLDSGYLLPLSIDVNHDGDPDVKVNNLNFFKPVISQSPFNNFHWFAFETTISDIEKISNDIKTEDDFTICLQFSLQIIEDYLGLEESVIRIGYHSSAGEEKPSSFSATHIFKPYIIFRLLNGNNNQATSQDMSAYPVVQSTTSSTTGMQTTTQSAQSLPLSGKMTNGQQPLTQGGAGGANTQNIGTENIVASSTEENLQQIPSQPTGGEEGKLIPENGIRLESTNADHFSLIISFSNTVGTKKTTFAATFESFTTTTLMHRRSESIRDVDLNGADDSALTLSITRENQHGTATLGILIHPLQSFGFHIDINKLANNARHIAFNIDNPPENLVLFAESEDTQGEQDAHYFYLKHLPTSVDFEWLPRLDNGYFELSKDYASDELEIGICDDLEDPYMNLYMTNLPTQTTLSWQITLELPRTITLTSNTEGLTLNAELKDVTQEDQTIEFHATANVGLDIKFLWSLPDGYFELQRSTRDIDFDFSLSQEASSLDITGNFQGGEDDGFVINFNGLEQGLIEVVNDVAFDMTISAENYVTETTLNTGLEFTSDGYTRIQWDESMNLDVDVAASVVLYDFMLSNPKNYLSAGEIALSGGTRFGLLLGENNVLQLGSTGEVSISNLGGEFGYWSGSIDSATAGGGFDILLKPMDKYYKIDNTGSSFILDGFNIEYDQPDGQEYDLILEMDNFEMYSEGTTWFDFSGVKPQFTLDGEDDIELTNFHLSVGSGTSGAIDFTISNAHVYKAGTIFGEWNESSLYIDAEVDFNWDLNIDTLNYGDWEAHGNLEGSGSMDAEWDDGSGSIELVIGESGLLHSLEIIHDDLTLNLGSFNFDPGTITFDWQREEQPNNGHFNIINNGVDGNLTLCKISYPPGGLELELGDIFVVSGNLYMDWSRTTDQKMIYINNGMTVDMDLIKVTKSGKTIALEGLGLKPGEFKFTWDTTNKEITLNNGIEDLGPSCYYEDADRKLAVDLTNLEHDYSKTMTLRWYETGGSISGIYLDTDGTQLVDWIGFESIKYDSSGDTGRRLALGGFQADNFELKKNVDGDLEVSGKLYIANHLTYSKLVNDDWKDLDVQWNLNLNGVGSIEFDIDFAFDLDALDISSSFLGVDITSNFDWEHPNYQHHIKFSWDVDFDLNGNVFIDTDWEGVDVTFTIKKDTASYQPKWGVSISATSMKAEDYMIYWDFSNPPGQWVIGNSGTIEPGSLNSVYIAWNGNWYNLLSGGTPV